MTNAPSSTNPNATRGDSWCRHYAVAASRLVPLPVSPLHPGATRLARGLAAMLEPADLLGGQVARKPRQLPPDGLKTAAQAAAKLNCSIKTLFGHVASGALKYVAIGHGKRRTRKMFADADLNEFIVNQTRKGVPCPSTKTRARHTGNLISSSEVIDFTAPRRLRPGGKRKP